MIMLLTVKQVKSLFDVSGPSGEERVELKLGAQGHLAVNLHASAGWMTSPHVPLPR